MKKLLIIILLLNFSLFAEKGKQTVETLPEVYAKRTVKLNKEFLLFKPSDYSEQKKFPLIIFLHGSGEGGSDIQKVCKHGIPKVNTTLEDFPFISISPQALMKPKKGWSTEDLDLLLEYALKTYSIDKDRIYLTGMSMGGYATWRWAAHRPSTFAAIAPVCGGGKAGNASKYAQLPIWNFHGAKDKVVDIQKSKTMVEAITKAKGNIKFTIYPNLGHNSWTKTYDNPELYKWFLDHKRN